MGWCSLILVSVVLMHHGTLKPNPLDELTINLNLNDAPNGGPTVGSPGIESKEWKTGKTSTKDGPILRKPGIENEEWKTNKASSKDSFCNKKRNQRQEKQTGEKRKRILGGERYIPHLRNDVPDYENWMASIRIRSGFMGFRICGGVLISPEHVLTALHCIFNMDVDKFHSFDKVKIYFDPENLEIGESTEFKPAKYYFVKGKSSRPDYLVNTINPKVKLLKDDIALIKLEKSINEFNRTASLQPLRISTISGKIASKGCEFWIAGWGIFELPKKVPKFLQYTNNLPGMDCPKYKTIRQNTMMCFEGTNKDATCGGDSGSPGVVFTNGNWSLQGIHIGSRGVTENTQHTPKCGDPKSISVNIDVYQYRKRIAEWMAE